MEADVESTPYGKYHTVVELSLRVHCGGNKRTNIRNYDEIMLVRNSMKVQAVASRKIPRNGDNGFRRLVSLGTFCSTWFNGGAKSG